MQHLCSSWRPRGHLQLATHSPHWFVTTPVGQLSWSLSYCAESWHGLSIDTQDRLGLDPSWRSVWMVTQCPLPLLTLGLTGSSAVLRVTTQEFTTQRVSYQSGDYKLAFWWNCGPQIGCCYFQTRVRVFPVCHSHLWAMGTGVTDGVSSGWIPFILEDCYSSLIISAHRLKSSLELLGMVAHVFYLSTEAGKSLLRPASGYFNTCFAVFLLTHLTPK